MARKTLAGWVQPAAAATGIAALAVGTAYLGLPTSEGTTDTASAAPYPFVFSQEGGLRVGTSTVSRPAGFLWADVSGDTLLLLTRDPGAPEAFGTLSSSALDGSGQQSLVGGVVSVPLVNATDGTITVLTRLSAADASLSLKKLSVATGDIIESIAVPLNSLLSTLKPNGQAIVTSGVDAFLWNTVQNLLQPLLEPGAVATQTMLTSATSNLEFHADPEANSSYLVARPSGSHVRTFDGLLDGKLIGDKLVLWDVDSGTLSRTGTTDNTDPRTPAPLPAGFVFVMAWHGSNFLARVSDVAPGNAPDDAGPGVSTYYDCDAVAWQCAPLGGPVNSDVADELGSTTSWQVRAAIELDFGPSDAPDELPDTPESEIE